MIAYLVACLFIPSQDYDCVRMADFQTIEQCESSISHLCVLDQPVPGTDANSPGYSCDRTLRIMHGTPP